MTTFKTNIEICAPDDWTTDDVVAALGELAAEYRVEIEGVVVQTEGGKEIERKNIAVE